VALDDESEPEPDVSVVPGSFRDYREHPRRPVLVVEIADSSLWLDREEKGSLYARASVPEYRIVNLADRRLEIRRQPEPDPGARHGWRYAFAATFAAGDTISPLAAPASTVPVVDLVP
jgi:Uma2 family endonuclease